MMHSACMDRTTQKLMLIWPAEASTSGPVSGTVGADLEHDIQFIHMLYILLHVIKMLYHIFIKTYIIQIYNASYIAYQGIFSVI